MKESDLPQEINPAQRGGRADLMPLGRHLLTVTKLLPSQSRNAAPRPPHVRMHFRLYIAFTPQIVFSFCTLEMKERAPARFIELLGSAFHPVHEVTLRLLVKGTKKILYKNASRGGISKLKHCFRTTITHSE